MNPPELKRTVPLDNAGVKALVGKRVTFFTGFDGNRGRLYGLTQGVVTRTSRKSFELDNGSWYEHGSKTFEFEVLGEGDPTITD